MGKNQAAKCLQKTRGMELNRFTWSVFASIKFGDEVNPWAVDSGEIADYHFLRRLLYYPQENSERVAMPKMKCFFRVHKTR
jgi:hypothetical protein